MVVPVEALTAPVTTLHPSDVPQTVSTLTTAATTPPPAHKVLKRR